MSLFVVAQTNFKKNLEGRKGNRTNQRRFGTLKGPQRCELFNFFHCWSIRSNSLHPLRELLFLKPIQLIKDHGFSRTSKKKTRRFFVQTTQKLYNNLKKLSHLSSVINSLHRCIFASKLTKEIPLLGSKKSLTTCQSLSHHFSPHELLVGCNGSVAETSRAEPWWFFLEPLEKPPTSLSLFAWCLLYIYI